MKKFSALILAFIMLFSFAACGDEFKVKSNEDFRDWYKLLLVPAYDGYISSPDADADAYPSVSLMLASDAYINYIFDYICDGVYPENGEITEENGVYTYAYSEFKQIFEFNTDKPAIKVTMLMEMMGESRTEFVAVLTQQKDEFLIQYITPTFGEYFEIRFTAETGSFVLETDCYELPYDIFNEDIPKDFAKEN